MSSASRKDIRRVDRVRSALSAGLGLLTSLCSIPAAALTETVSSTKDAWVWSVAPDNNIGATTTADVGRTVPKSGPVLLKRGLLHFDVSSLPANVTINSATLRLYIDRTSADPLALGLTVWRLSSDFVEGDNTSGVTWNTQPGVEGSPTDTGTMSTAAGQWFELDMTDVVLAERSSAAPNTVGIRVAGTDETTVELRDFGFRTREHGTGTHAPQLVIDYTLPTPTFTPTPVPPPTATPTETPTATGTPTVTPTPPPTSTNTATPTDTPSGPTVHIDSPLDGAFIRAFSSIDVSGVATGADTVTVNGDLAELDGSNFTASVSISEGFQGPLVITAVAESSLGTTFHSITVTVDITPPQVIIGQPTDGAVLVDEAAIVTGMLVSGGDVMDLRLNSVSFPVAQFFAAEAELALGSNFLTVEAVDAAGNVGSDTVVVTRRLPPPDPIDVKSPIDRTVVESLFDQTAFLYGGEDPIQILADASVIDRRISVLRGRVQSPDGSDVLQPLAGASVSILNHPELGSTATRADGGFDLAVNGGGVVTVVIERPGYMPVHRQVDAPWQDYAVVDDVVLLPYDTAPTAIDLTTSPTLGFHVARQSTPSTDADGTREAIMLFPAGVSATLQFADGTQHPIDHLSVRATEYTVGPHGLAAMPAPLPPTSAYTYAVELSVVEAEYSGATSVTFDAPVRLYVDNFLNFDVGTVVPVGYYERMRGTWIPSADGAVIAITSINLDEEAEIDLDGDSEPEDPAELDAQGITEAERKRLAVEYFPPTTLWRVPITHFSTYDCNWALGEEETPTETPTPTPTPTPEPDDPDCEEGSIIECQSQTLGERLPIVATDFSLVYRSNRVEGRRSSRVLDIPLIGSTVSELLELVLLRIDVAGITTYESFDAEALTPNQTYHFEWDGRDAYGRLVQGARRVTVRRAYVYGSPSYGAITGVTTAPAFGRRRSAPTTVVQRAPETVWRTIRSTFLTWDTSPLELGGWTLDVHHSYDPVGRVLYRGDGTRETRNALGLAISTAAGTGVTGDSGDGGPATAAQIQNPPGLAVAPDGTVYFGQHSNEIVGNSVVRAIDPDGTIRRVAGQGEYGASEGFFPFALAYKMASPDYVALGPDGALYISDSQNGRVLRVQYPENSLYVERIAGTTGVFGYAGDGGDAKLARFGSVAGLAVAADGWVYVADSEYHVIRGIAPDGTIWTIAGNGSPGHTGDGGPATAATLQNPFGVAVGPDGTLFVADTGNHAIRRIDRVGTITTVAGVGTAGYGGDGGAATSALLATPIGIAVAPDGTLYIADAANRVIRAVDANGMIVTVAGRFAATELGDRGPAPLARLRPSGVAVGPDGSLYVSEFSADRIRRIERPLPGFVIGSLIVPADDRDEVYTFDSDGRHRRTRHALTGEDLYTFTYDLDSGLLTHIHDGDGNTTEVVRDEIDGSPLAIVSPYGQVTELTLDGDGFLERVTNPADEFVQLDHREDGLLESFTNARGHTSTFTYDAAGRLERDDDPAGGYKVLSRTTSESGYEVLVKTAVELDPLVERETVYAVETRADGGMERTTTQPDGTETRIVVAGDGSRETTLPDGTVHRIEQGPDSRFGMLAGVGVTETTETGTRLTAITRQQDTIPAPPADPFDWTTWSEVTSINGAEPFERSFDKPTKTWTMTSPEERTSLMTIDGQGRVERTAVTGLHPVVRAYDANGRLHTITHGPDPDPGSIARVTTFAYKDTGDDQNGYLDTITDPAGRVTQFTYDDAGRMDTQTFQPGTADERVALYEYDANGNLTGLTPPDRDEHEFQDNEVNLESLYSPPQPDPPLVPAAARTTAYAYNLAREVKLITLPGVPPADGGTIDFSYQDGRLDFVTLPGGEQREHAYYPTGQLQTITTPDVTLAFTYDGALPQTETWTIGVDSHTVTHSYNNELRLSALRVDTRDPIEFEYDDDGLLEQAGVLELTPDPDHGLLESTEITGAGATVADIRTYTMFGELQTYTASLEDPGDLYQVAYEYDALGRIVHRSETVLGVGPAHTFYRYDAAGRLWQVCSGEPCDDPGTDVQAEYVYDRNGNRTDESYNLASGDVLTVNYDDQDRLLTYETDSEAAAFAYTANGDLLTKTVGTDVTRYRYDAFGNLRTVILHESAPGETTIEYLVDGRNRRIAKKVDGVLSRQWLYKDQLEPIAELDGAGNIVAEFVYGSQPHVPDYMLKDGSIFRIVSDHLGSPRLVVNLADGTVAQRVEYDEFGTPTMTVGTWGVQPFGFAGGIYDDATKLVRFGARDYDPTVGRWTAKDPIRFIGQDTNLYGYVSNDPVNEIDPNGLIGGPLSTDSLSRSFWNAVSKGKFDDAKWIIEQATHSPEARRQVLRDAVRQLETLDKWRKQWSRTNKTIKEIQEQIGSLEKTLGRHLKDRCGDRTPEVERIAGQIEYLKNLLAPYGL